MQSTLQAHNVVVYYQYTSVYYQYFKAPLSPFRCMDAFEPGSVPTEWWVWLCPKTRSDEKT